MAVPNVLLLTGTIPGSQGIGEIFLKDLCLAYPHEKIFCYAVPWEARISIDQDLEWLSLMSYPQPLMDRFKILRHVFPKLANFLKKNYLWFFEYSKPINSIIEYGKSQKIDLIWSVLNFPSVVKITRRVASALNIPFVATVWDPPQSTLFSNGYDQYSVLPVLREFGKILNHSERCGVASESMGEFYRDQYGITPIVMIHGIHSRLRKPPAKNLTSKDKFVIGFAGSAYAQREWTVLVSALEKINWNLDGRNVIVRVLGRNFPITFSFSSEARIEYLGWRSLGETIEILSQVDITYLPYWFDPSHELAVKLCFPNKITTYLAAGRPILFHGPRNSSPSAFFNKFPVGIGCHSLDETELVECLRKFILDKNFYEDATHAGQRALDSELNSKVFLQRFAALVGIEDTELLPIP